MLFRYVIVCLLSFSFLYSSEPPKIINPYWLGVPNNQSSPSLSNLAIPGIASLLLLKRITNPSNQQNQVSKDRIREIISQVKQQHSTIAAESGSLRPTAEPISPETRALLSTNLYSYLDDQLVDIMLEWPEAQKFIIDTALQLEDDVNIQNELNLIQSGLDSKFILLADRVANQTCLMKITDSFGSYQDLKSFIRNHKISNQQIFIRNIIYSRYKNLLNNFFKMNPLGLTDQQRFEWLFLGDLEMAAQVSDYLDAIENETSPKVLQQTCAQYKVEPAQLLKQAKWYATNKGLIDFKLRKFPNLTKDDKASYLLTGSLTAGGYSIGGLTEQKLKELNLDHNKFAEKLPESANGQINKDIFAVFGRVEEFVIQDERIINGKFCPLEKKRRREEYNKSYKKQAIDNALYFVSLADEYNRRGNAEQASSLVSIAHQILDFIQGAGEGLFDTLKAPFELAVHPLQTVNNLLFNLEKLGDFFINEPAKLEKIKNAARSIIKNLSNASTRELGYLIGLSGGCLIPTAKIVSLAKDIGQLIAAAERLGCAYEGAVVLRRGAILLYRAGNAEAVVAVFKECGLSPVRAEKMMAFPTILEYVINGLATYSKATVALTMRRIEHDTDYQSEKPGIKSQIAQPAEPQQIDSDKQGPVLTPSQRKKELLIEKESKQSVVSPSAPPPVKEANQEDKEKDENKNKQNNACKDSDQVEHYIKLGSGKTIKEFTSKVFEAKKNQGVHLFSEEHLLKGLLDLGFSIEQLQDKLVKMIIEADQVGVLKESMNQFYTYIKQTKITVRVYIQRGKVLSVNLFVGHTSRLLGNIIDWVKGI